MSRFPVTNGILDGLERQAFALLPMVIRDYRESGLDQRSEVTDMIVAVREARAELDAAETGPPGPPGQQLPSPG